MSQKQDFKEYEKKYLATVAELDRIALKVVRLVSDELSEAGLTSQEHAVWPRIDFHRASWQLKNFVPDV